MHQGPLSRSTDNYLVGKVPDNDGEGFYKYLPHTIMVLIFTPFLFYRLRFEPIHLDSIGDICWCTTGNTFSMRSSLVSFFTLFEIWSMVFSGWPQ